MLPARIKALIRNEEGDSNTMELLTAAGGQWRELATEESGPNGGEEAPVKNRRRPVPVLDPTASRTPVLRPCAHAEPRPGSGSALESRDDSEVTPRRKDFLT